MAKTEEKIEAPALEPESTFSLTDEYIEQQRDGSCPVLPHDGYHVVMVRNDAATLASYCGRNQVRPLPYSARKQYLQNPEICFEENGLTCFADGIVCVETQEHYRQRMAAKAKHRVEKRESLSKAVQAKIMQSGSNAAALNKFGMEAPTVTTDVRSEQVSRALEMTGE